MPTILEEYIARHPGSAQRYQESVNIFPGGVTHDTRYATPFPLFMTHGVGPRKWDVDGNEYVGLRVRATVRCCWDTPTPP